MIVIGQLWVSPTVSVNCGAGHLMNLWSERVLLEKLKHFKKTIRKDTGSMVVLSMKVHSLYITNKIISYI